jgi:type II secretory pathway component PulF
MSNARLKAVAAAPAVYDEKRADQARRRLRKSPATRLLLWKNLSALLENHNLVEALEIIAQSFSEDGARPNNLVAMVATAWIIPLRNSQKFSDVIKGGVTDRERLIISVSQDKKTFPQILVDMYTSEKRLHDIKQQWRAAIRDPLVMIIVTWVMLVGNAYMSIYQNRMFDMKPDGYVLMALEASEWIYYTGSWLIPVFSVAIAIGFSVALKYWLHSSRVAFERVFPFSTYKKMVGADFLYSFSILQSSGDSIPASLLAMSRIAAGYLLWQIAAMEPIARTKSIGYTFAKVARRFPDPMANAQISIANERTPLTFPARLKEITHQYSDELIDHLEFVKDVTKNVALGVTGLLQIITLIIMLANSLQGQSQ